MRYKTIIVHMDADPRRRQRLDLAASLAKRYGARLIGLFAAQTPQIPIAPEALPLLVEDMLNERRKAAEEAAREFDEKMRREQYTEKSEWRSALGDGFAALLHQANYADLVIAGQPNAGGNGVPPWFSEQLAVSIARPVLYVPFAGPFDDCGKRVLVAWNASREAARAVNDALPFLQKAQAVEVVTFGANRNLRDALASPAKDMAAYLLQHGVRASVTVQPMGDIDVGQAILGRAADNAVDLMVMGAYSHSRIRELVFGGATRSIFQSMTVPTLMSH